MNYRAIYEAHHGPIPPGHVVHHVNGDHADDRVENLTAVTRSEHVALHRAMPKPQQLNPYDLSITRRRVDADDFSFLLMMQMTRAIRAERDEAYEAALAEGMSA